MAEVRPAGAASTIEVRVRTPGQLFNSFDPSPFRERDLDDDAEQFIIDWAREFPQENALEIVIRVPRDELDKCDALDIPSAVANHFAYRATTERRELDELFRIGRRHLAVGLSIFVGCIILSQIVQQMLPRSPLADLMRESLIIVGWVANWKPLEILLYDWWPIRRRIRLLHRLAEARVSVMAEA